MHDINRTSIDASPITQLTEIEVLIETAVNSVERTEHLIRLLSELSLRLFGPSPELESFDGCHGDSGSMGRMRHVQAQQAHGLALVEQLTRQLETL